MSTQTQFIRLVPILLLSLIAYPLSAFTDITGKVIDESGEPLPFVNVLLLKEDSSLIKGDITNEEGEFSIEAVATGDYLLSVSMVGFKTEYYSLKVASGQNMLKVGEIQLQEEVAQLAEVEVRARKPLFEQKMDRMVINVQNSITSAGGSVLDILEKSPGVRVNRQRSSIIMGGKDGVLIMINGKESRMPLEAAVQMLQGMRAENVESIELLTTPPAKYDAEGNAGIINIVLKKNENYGTNGSFSLNAGYGIFEKYGGSLNFNHRSGRINIYGDYSYSLDHTSQPSRNTRSLVFNNTATMVDTKSKREAFVPIHNGRLGVDYEIGQKTILGVLLSVYDRRWDMDAFNEVSIRENGTLITTMDIPNREVNNRRHYTGNFNVHHTLTDEQTLSFNADYLRYRNNNPTDYQNEILDVRSNNSSEDHFRMRKVTPLHILVGKLDYVNNIGESFKLEAGLKSTFSRFENDVRLERLNREIWETDPEFTQFVTLREDILAAYSSFRYDISDQTTLSAGLRYEYTSSNLSSPEEKDLVDRHYGNLFPTLFFSQKIDEHHSIQASYNRRITRPTFNDLAPFVIFIDPTTLISGNSALQPAVSNTLKADYRFKTWLLSLSYTHEEDAIATFQPSVEPESNKQIFAASNMDFLNTWNATITFPVYFTGWWESQNSVTGLWQQLQSSAAGQETIDVRQKNLSFTSTHSFKLPSNFSLELSGFYQSTSLWGYVSMKPFGSVDIGLQKEFGDGSKLRLAFTDMFNTNDWRWKTELPGQNLDSFFFYDFENRKLMLTYTRSFGSEKVKSARQRSTGSEEERQRVND